MYPEFDLNVLGRHLAPATYTVSIVLGGLAAVVMGAITASRRGIPFRVSLALLVIALIAEFVGARALHRLASPLFYAGHPGLVFTLSRIGLSVYGGLILAALLIPVVCRLMRVNLWKFADSVAPALGIGIAISRAGCFLNGCCWGRVTSVPWAVSYPMGSPAYFDQLSHKVIGLLDVPRPVHPTQIYEALAAIGCAILAAWLMRRGTPDGIAFAALVGTFTAFRWFNLRLLAGKDAEGHPAWLYPVLYSLVLALCAVIALVRARAERDAVSAVEE